MGYILELRKLVGSRPLIQVGSKIVVLDGLNRVLLVRRGDNGKWAFPSGSMEPGESLEGTARRELLEETGLQAGTLTFLACVSGPEYYYQYPNGDEVYNVTAEYITKEVSGELKADGEEVVELRFFAPDQIPLDQTIGVEQTLKRLHTRGEC
jgi:8-oxo-dGTP pyrophosphatase MutT (NUDIX family)